MDSSVVVLPPSAEAATTGGVAQAEAENIELSPISTQSPPPGDAAQQVSGYSSSSDADQPRRSSRAWSIIRIPSVSTFSSFGPQSSEFFGRYKTIIYKHSLKILGILCGLGALALAWINLKSPMKPNDIDVQSLAALNKSAGSQVAIYEVL